MPHHTRASLSFASSSPPSPQRPNLPSLPSWMPLFIRLFLQSRIPSLRPIANRGQVRELLSKTDDDPTHEALDQPLLFRRAKDPWIPN